MYTGPGETGHTRAKGVGRRGGKRRRKGEGGGGDSGSRGRAKRKGAFLFSRLGAAPYRCVYQRPLPRGNVN